MSKRRVRSPAAPKMTSTQDGAGGNGVVIASPSRTCPPNLLGNVQKNLSARFSCSGPVDDILVAVVDSQKRHAPRTPDVIFAEGIAGVDTGVAAHRAALPSRQRPSR